MIGEKEEKEILYFKTEKERMAYLRNKITIEPIEYIEEEKKPEKIVETDKVKKKGKKKVVKEVQTD